MGKMLKRIGILLLVIVMISTGCTTKEGAIKRDTLITDDLNGINPQKINQYHMDITFYPQDGMLHGKQIVEYFNNDPVALKEIYFHIYPNSFEKQETAPFLFDDFKNAYPDGFKPGYIHIKKVGIDGSNAYYGISGQGNTIMKVVLPKELNPNEKIAIEMEYDVKLPPAQERFGYGEDTYNFGNWYPVAAVYDEKGWNLDPYYPIGDPFYSDASNYNVKIETPKDYVIASTGNIIKDKITEEKRQWEIETKVMRDFAWVASKNFKVEEWDVDGTVLKMYFIGNVDEPIKDVATLAAENSLKVFNRVYGRYPYGQYSVVQTNFPSGMEYPGIVFIGKQYYDKDFVDYLEIVIVHETAHQWWYGIVGNDEIDEAWLDESLAAYSEVVYAREMFGDAQAESYHRSANEDQYLNMVSSIQNTVVLKPLDQFEGWDDYGPLVYTKGAMFLNEIHKKYGYDKFYAIMQDYYKNQRFKNATTMDFKESCERVIGESFDDLFNQWIFNE